jgi:hypothetical protein
MHTPERGFVLCTVYIADLPLASLFAASVAVDVSLVCASLYAASVAEEHFFFYEAGGEGCEPLLKFY